MLSWDLSEILAALKQLFMVPGALLGKYLMAALYSRKKSEVLIVEINKMIGFQLFNQCQIISSSLLIIIIIIINEQKGIHLPLTWAKRLNSGDSCPCPNI